MSEIILNDCGFENENCMHLLKLLSNRNFTLELLDLASNHITFRAVECLVDILCLLKVKKVNLSDNRLRDEGIKHFAITLSKKHHMLVKIELINNKSNQFTEGEFMHIGNYKGSVCITKNTKCFIENTACDVSSLQNDT